jgi:hypothetical protein
VAASELVKAVLVDKATRLAAAGLEKLLDEAEALGLPRDEALAICNRTNRGTTGVREPDRVLQTLGEALEPRPGVEGITSLVRLVSRYWSVRALQKLGLRNASYQAL